LAIALGGLTDGLRMMKISEMRRLWVPARLANPAAAYDQPDLVFDVTLKHISRIESAEVDPSDDKMKPLDRPRTPPKSAKKTSSGLTFLVLKAGGKKTGTPNANDIVIINYAGYTEDGRLFDSSNLRSAGRRGVGYDRVIPALLMPGLAEGIPLMRAGEKCRFWIPSKLAYGLGAAGRGLPEGNLIVDVEVGRFH
jgi:peptidylprolyl isomerase